MKDPLSTRVCAQEACWTTAAGFYAVAKSSVSALTLQFELKFLYLSFIPLRRELNSKGEGGSVQQCDPLLATTTFDFAKQLFSEFKTKRQSREDNSSIRRDERSYQYLKTNNKWLQSRQFHMKIRSSR